MIKKVILSLFLIVICLFWINQSFSNGPKSYIDSNGVYYPGVNGVTYDELNNANIAVQNAQNKLKEAQNSWDKSLETKAEESLSAAEIYQEELAEWTSESIAAKKKQAEEYKNISDKANSDKAKADHAKACKSSWNCIDQPTFEIKTSLFTPWIKTQDDKGNDRFNNTSEVINYTLGTIIQKLMVALWVLAVLIMTVWSGYIIMYHGQDELLSKGKSIFMAGVTSLVVALSSYYLVSILRFILYN
jgi:hypothetical protein